MLHCCSVINNSTAGLAIVGAIIRNLMLSRYYRTFSNIILKLYINILLFSEPYVILKMGQLFVLIRSTVTWFLREICVGIGLP